MSTTISTREFLLSVIDGNVTDEVVAKAQTLLEGLDARNAKRKSADSKEKRETLARRNAVFGVLSDHPVLAEDYAAATGLTVGQVRAALTALVHEGRADKHEVKVGKTKRIAYSIHRDASV